MLPAARPNALRGESPVDDDPRCALRTKIMRNGIDPFRWIGSGGDEYAAFGRCIIYPYMDRCDYCYVRINNDLENENTRLREDYDRALKALEKLRLEIRILKDEKKIFFETIRKMKLEFLKDRSYQKTAAMVLLYARLQNRRLI
jgi:hypothetical protein